MGDSEMRKKEGKKLNKCIEMKKWKKHFMRLLGEINNSVIKDITGEGGKRNK